ncbi:MAG TPA: hypothetical protein VMP00_03450, partial [Burkholderiales bacterium]|nr:hypothetical protein [Burkholderiales bacterium]
EGAGAEAATLLTRVLALPDVAEIAQVSQVEQDFPPVLVVHFRKDDLRLSLFSMIATVGAPMDVSLQNLRLELFFPADDATAQWFARGVPTD